MSRRPCHKLGFDTVEQAERTLSVIASLATGKTPPTRLYDCRRCGRMHFTSKSEEEVIGTPTTVIELEAPTPAFTTPPPTVAFCHRCGASGAKFELDGHLYHRRCRSIAFGALPSADRQRIQRERSHAGQVSRDAKETP